MIASLALGAAADVAPAQSSHALQHRAARDRTKRGWRSPARSALLATLLSVAALDLAVDFSATAAAQDVSMQGLDRLKTLPLIEVIRSGIAVYTRDYDAAVEGYVRGNPKLLQWAEEMRPRVTDRDRVAWLTLRLHELVGADEASKQKLAQLPKAHQQLLYLSVFEAEVFNGGVEQFFLNFSGDVAPQVAQTLGEVGLKNEAETVMQGIALFPPPYPVDRQHRVSLMTGRKGHALDKKLQDISDHIDARGARRAMIDLVKREGLMPQ